MSFGIMIKDDWGESYITSETPRNLLDIISLRGGNQTVTLPPLPPNSRYEVIFLPWGGSTTGVITEYTKMSISGRTLRYTGRTTVSGAHPYIGNSALWVFSVRN